MTKQGTTPLHEARRAAAKELGVKASDPRAIRLATLLCAYDSVQAQLAAGRTVDVDNLLKLDAALAQARVSVAPPPEVKVTFVEQLHGICQKCGHSQPQAKTLPGPVAPSPPPSKPSASLARRATA
jgi:hypothetical protein